ncbi:hypothetical protein [Acinetobacter baumannii]
MKAYLPYLPLVIAILAASMAYIATQRNNKINRFYQQVDINLKEVLGPIYFSIKNIFEVNEAKKREDYLDELFSDTFSNVNLYKLGNEFIIEYLIQTKVLYTNFKKTRQIKDWEIFWGKFYSLYIMIDNYYWDNFYSLYGEYRWFQKTLSSNVFIRIWNEVLYLLFQATQFSLIVSSLFVFYTIYDRVIIKQLPSDTLYLALLLFLLISMFFGLLTIIGADIHGLRQKKRSLPRKLGEKYIPKLMDYWDNKFLVKKQKVNIPEMHKKSIDAE